MADTIEKKPLAEPTENERRIEFLQRCMSNSIMVEEYPDTDQRYAVCLTQWDNKNDSR